MNEPTLVKAMSALEYLSQDSEARRLYEIETKGLFTMKRLYWMVRVKRANVGENFLAVPKKS